MCSWGRHVVLRAAGCRDGRWVQARPGCETGQNRPGGGGGGGGREDLSVVGECTMLRPIPPSVLSAVEGWSEREERDEKRDGGDASVVEFRG